MNDSVSSLVANSESVRALGKAKGDEWIPESAKELYMEKMGLYNPQAVTSYKEAVAASHVYQNIVCTDMVGYQMLYASVGPNHIRSLISLVLNERNCGHDPWVLVNFYRGLGSGALSLSSVIDLYNKLDDGLRRNAVIAYISEQKSKIDTVRGIDATIECFGAFAGLLTLVVTYIENCFKDLEGYNDHYYTSLCTCSVKFCGDNHLLLEFHPRVQGEFVINTTSMTQLAAMACCGNDGFVRKFFEFENARVDRLNALMQQQEMTRLQSVQHIANPIIDSFRLNKTKLLKVSY